MNLRLDWCSSEAASYACLHWHYSKTVQVGKSAKLGVWEDERFIGAVVFTQGSGTNTMYWGKRVGLEPMQMAELARVALQHTHQTPVSRIVAIAVKMLRGQSPGLRLLVSYADPAQGHHGGVYQAAGWIYVGESTATPEWILPDGRRLHNRVVRESGFVRQFGRLEVCPRKSECVRVDKPPKHKYFLPLDDEIRARILLLSKPYPKRVSVGSDPADTSVFHTEEGGSTPTPTLQNEIASVQEQQQP